MNREIAFDCRYFLGDRPCVWHKREGAICTCDRYEQIGDRLLIIKLDAMGDVLRTTTLLPGLMESHKNPAIAWITRPESIPLLENNPCLTELIPYGSDALVYLASRSFDRVINPDAGTVSAGLASLARGKRKDGFLLDDRGAVVPTNDAAREWLEMGVFDDLKRRNTRTYQGIMADILSISPSGMRYVFELTESERSKAREHLENLGINFNCPVIGLNTGAGRRWQFKQWREEGFLELIELLHAGEGSEAQILLLGGRAERERNERIRRTSRLPVFDSGFDNEIRHFAALLAYCDVVVAGDTLAMHIAIALGRRVVILFGPTSSSEIDLYGQGEKILPEMECLSCYKQTCDFVPNCMELISSEVVGRAVVRQLSLLRQERAIS